MKFTEIISSARTNALEEEKKANAKVASSAARQTKYMRDLNSRLQEISSELERIPATLSVSDVISTVSVQQGRYSLQIHMTYEHDIWKAYLLSIEESSPSSLDERSDKAVTVEETISLLARTIGQFQAKHQ